MTFETPISQFDETLEYIEGLKTNYSNKNIMSSRRDLIRIVVFQQENSYAPKIWNVFQNVGRGFLKKIIIIEYYSMNSVVI